MKIIAFYLPQFHTFPENDKWWGKGFTEWTNTKKAKPLFKGHNQPRTPLNENYYNLLDDEVKKRQVKLAKENGIYGFCYYHYWFKNGKKLMEKPVEQMLKNKEIDMPFCLSWANEPWSRRWDGSENEIIMPQEYGEKEEWKKHFLYLYEFFKDERYIKIDGNPLFIIYKPELIPNLNEMIDYWNELAQQNNFKKIVFAYQYPTFYYLKNKDDSRFTYGIQFEPFFSNGDIEYTMKNKKEKICFLIKNFDILFRKIKNKVYKMLHLDKPNLYSYKKTWKRLLNNKPVNDKMIPGAFVDWDNTARRGKNATCYLGANPSKFKTYMKKLVKKTQKEYNKDMIFINAWNEWAEGAYLEPDEKYGYQYLEAIKELIKEVD
ncbi:MAG: glycosyl transferase [Clostridia bacterium]|nr:glycosyl transferase [Clostridia bacterium]